MTPIEQLTELVWGALTRLGPLTGLEPTEISDRIDARCARVVADLVGGDARAAAEACISVMAVAPDDDATWWATPLGRLVARTLDGQAVVSRQGAAALLGVTAGTIAQLTARGTLIRDDAGHVVVSSVLERLDRLAGAGRG